MSEDKVQVKIEADTSAFSGALKDAISQLTDSVKSMKNSFADLAGSIKDSMSKATDSAKDAAKNIADGMKESADKTAASTSEAVQTLNNGIKTSMDAAVNTVSEAAISMSGDMESSMQQAASETSQTTKAMADDVKKSTEESTNALSRVKNIIGSIGIGIVGAFGNAAKETIAYEKSLLGLSRTSGLSIEATSRLAYAASQYGLSSEDLGRNVGILSRNIAVLEKDTDSAANVFNRFNIDVHDTSGKLLSTDQILLNVADRFKSMPDGVQKTALSMSLFGRQGQSMIPMLNQGSAGIKKLGKDAEALGLVFKDVEALKAYTAATKQYNTTMKSLQVQMGTAVLPVLTAFSKAITNILKVFNGLDPAFKTTVITAISVAGAIASLTLGWGAAAAAIAAFGGPFARVGVMMQSMPNVAIAAKDGVKSLVVGMTDATIAAVKFIAPANLMTTASNAVRAVSTTTAAAMHGVRTAVLATSLAYNTGGIKSVVSYGASLVTMNGIAKVARLGLMLLYSTVLAGVAVVAGLALAWTGNFGNIREATAGTCDGIIYGLNNFADGVSQIMSGIGKIFTSLALTIGKALVGDFSGAIEEAKGLLEGIKTVGVGSFGVMQGTAQVISGVVSNPEGAMDFAGKATGAIGNGLSGLMGFGGRDDADAMGGFDDFGGAGGGGVGGRAAGGGSGGGNEVSAYEKAKKLYEEQIQLAERSAAEKETLYKEYLENVQKSDQEAMDYRIGLYGLEKDALAEKLHEEEVDLENSKISGTKTEKQYVSELAAIKRNSLNAEVEFRAKAAMELAQLSEEEKAKQLEDYKAKAQGTLWYKEALKGVLEAEKTNADYQKSIANKMDAYKKQMALNAINVEEKRMQTLYEQEAISKEELLAAQQVFEDRRFEIEKASLEKSLDDMAYNSDAMKDAYLRYANARDAATKQMIVNEMRQNGKSEAEIIEAFERLEELYGQHTDKKKDLEKSLKDQQIKNALEVKNTLKDSMSQAFQDVLTGASSFTKALKTIWSSTMKTILKQFTDTIFTTITNKAFNKKNQDKVNNDPNLSKNINDKGKVIAEKAAQAQMTAANAQGNAQRLAQDQTTSGQQVTTTETKAATQEATEKAKDGSIAASAQAAGAASVKSIWSSIEAMWQMLPMLILMSVLTGLFNGGGKSKTTESTGEGINLGRNPDSYYTTPSLAGIPSFDVGSWQLPADTLAMVHKNEMIVPAKGGIADGMRNMLSSGGMQSAPTINLSYSAAHYGRTNRDVQNEMRENAKFMVKTLDGQYRNFNRGKK